MCDVARSEDSDTSSEFILSLCKALISLDYVLMTEILRNMMPLLSDIDFHPVIAYLFLERFRTASILIGCQGCILQTNCDPCNRRRRL